MIKMYNEKIGGVDFMKQNVNRYRVGIKGKKRNGGGVCLHGFPM